LSILHLVLRIMDFLTEAEEKMVVDAIKSAEKNTSGELRVHIEDKCPKKEVNERVIEVFAALKMHETEQKNGILLYISTDDKKIGIWGGQGIHDKVGQNFWEEEIALIVKYFKDGKKAEGLSLALEQIGEKLREFFPYQKDDVNELDDNISYGKPKNDESNEPKEEN